MKLPGFMKDKYGLGLAIGWTLTFGILAVAMVAGVIVAIAIPASLASDHSACNQVHQQTGLPTTYRPQTGCYINPDGRGFIPYDRWVNVTGGQK